MTGDERWLMHWRLAVLMAVACIWTNAPAADAAASGIELQVRVQPTPVSVMGTLQLVYELHVVNHMTSTVTLDRVEVLQAKPARSPVALFEGEGLTSRLAAPPASAGAVSPGTLLPGAEAMVYLELSFDPSTKAAPALVHRVTVQAGVPLSVEGARLVFSRDPPIKLGAPLGCGNWVAIYDPTWERGHRRMRYTVAGRERIPARLAIDWVRVDNTGRHARGDGSKVEDWYGYGAEVLAVADGTVAASRDGMAEPSTIDAGGSLAAGDGSGNYITLDLGHGRFGTYEHLQPGSLKVKAGDFVRRGQVIARLGFTGDSTGPHLHFHASDANAVLGAEGMPYVIDRFQVAGTYSSIDAFGRAQAWVPRKPGTRADRRAEFPASLSVVGFVADPKTACPS